MANKIPVITIDGVSGTGKGTICQLLAQQLGWHYLDSGILYRVLAYAAQRERIAFDDEPQLSALAGRLNITFDVKQQGAPPRVLLSGEDVSDTIRTERCGNWASQVSVFAAVRQALVEKQRSFRKAPGLVTDGRDMGTVIFPDADHKFFFTASLDERSKRRHNQLKEMGINVNLDDLLKEQKVRDERDRKRQVAPLKPADDAIIIDTTGLTIEQVLAKVLDVVSTN